MESPHVDPPVTTPLLLLVGPTGTGKTAVGIELCEMLGGEIVSADSMQIYRGCDIGTAKASEEEQVRAPHHLVDILEPQQEYSAARWAQDAATAIADIRRRGKQPIVVGGTGFYIRALLQPEHLAEVPPNPELRARLENDVARHGVEALHTRLAQLDAAAAARLHPNDVRRVIRAIEVALGPEVETTGEQSEDEQSEDAAAAQTLAAMARERVHCGKTPLTSPVPVAYHSINFGLEMPREQLYRRLEQRIDTMLELGFMDELRWLSQLPEGGSITSLQSLGYRQMLPALADPEQFDECLAIWKRDTRRYAKRQMTWFRHQLPVQWIAIDDKTSPAEAATQIVQLWREQLQQTDVG